MDDHKPEMRKRSLDDRVLALPGVEPVQKRLHLGLEPLGSWRFKVNAFAAEGPRHHLYGASLFGTRSADSDLQHAGPSRREESGMPAEQPLCAKPQIVFLGGIEHQLNHPLDVPFSGGKGRVEPLGVHGERRGRVW
jgi:hypothetical protein